jgi:hypothetical protein
MIRHLSEDLSNNWPLWFSSATKDIRADVISFGYTRRWSIGEALSEKSSKERGICTKFHLIPLNELWASLLIPMCSCEDPSRARLTLDGCSLMHFALISQAEPWVRSDRDVSSCTTVIEPRIKNFDYLKPRGWRNVDPVYRVGGGGVRSGVEIFFVT